MKHIILLLCCFLVACSSLPSALEPSRQNQSCVGTEEIYVVDNGWYTGLVIKANELNKLLPALAIRFPQNLFYEIGWGDKGFYQANEITTELTLRAMFYSSGSVIHVVALDEEPRLYFMHNDMQVVSISTENYRNLLKFIQSSFQTDATGKPIAEKHGIYGNSQFYTGVGTYHLFNTCNKWTAKALYSAGLAVSPMLKLTASSVMNSLPQCANTGE